MQCAARMRKNASPERLQSCLIENMKRWSGTCQANHSPPFARPPRLLPWVGCLLILPQSLCAGGRSNASAGLGQCILACRRQHAAASPMDRGARSPQDTPVARPKELARGTPAAAEATPPPSPASSRLNAAEKSQQPTGEEEEVTQLRDDDDDDDDDDRKDEKRKGEEATRRRRHRSPEEKAARLERKAAILRRKAAQLRKRAAGQQAKEGDTQPKRKVAVAAGDQRKREDEEEQVEEKQVQKDAGEEMEEEAESEEEAQPQQEQKMLPFHRRAFADEKWRECRLRCIDELQRLCIPSLEDLLRGLFMRCYAQWCRLR